MASDKFGPELPDIKPRSPVTGLEPARYEGKEDEFTIEFVAPVIGMSPSFIRRALGRKSGPVAIPDILFLLNLDEYSETFVRRSQVLDYLLSEASRIDDVVPDRLPDPESADLHCGSVLDLLAQVTPGSVNCVVTSTPYWALRIYEESQFVEWADGEVCPLGHEQTPEGFVRHTTEILHRLRPALSDDASVWWNLMDSFNTRTQIRGSAVEALRAMQGKDDRGWNDHECRRYSAGHSFLKDGEQCLIPSQVAYRAARIGYFTKSVITWAKSSTLPEPQNSRVSRTLEYILHLSVQRTPKFDKGAFRRLPPSIGGRNPDLERDKLSDVWTISTSSGGNGHGAQFPLALPGRCISISTEEGDLVLDPFVGSGNSALAARKLGRRFLGFDVSAVYLAEARKKLCDLGRTLF